MTHSSEFRAAFGMDAAEIAGHIPGCSNVAAESDVNNAAGRATGAQCVMSGHKLGVITWTRRTASGVVSNLNGARYYAHGDGWSAIIEDSIASAADRELMQSVASALGGEVLQS